MKISITSLIKFIRLTIKVFHITAHITFSPTEVLIPAEMFYKTTAKVVSTLHCSRSPHLWCSRMNSKPFSMKPLNKFHPLSLQSSSANFIWQCSQLQFFLLLQHYLKASLHTFYVYLLLATVVCKWQSLGIIWLSKDSSFIHTNQQQSHCSILKICFSNFNCNLFTWAILTKKIHKQYIII